MNKQQQVIHTITTAGLLPLYFHPSQNISAGVLKALYDAGVRAVEYTNRGAEAPSNFIALKQLCGTTLKDMYLGIGTIKNAAAAKAFIEAGADFIISPGLSEEAGEIARQRDVLWIPGCMTPTDIMQAENGGARLVKLFPGNILGTAYVSAVKEVFPGMLMMPTGGVDTTKENLEQWFGAGVCAVGMGSKLVSKKVMDAEDYTVIIRSTKDVLQTIEAVRKQTKQ